MYRRIAPALVLTILAILASITARADVGIIGDDEVDAFVGSGSLLLPPQVFHDGRVVASDCAGCRWRAVLQCEMSTAGSCRGPARLCGADGSWLRVYVSRPGMGEVDLGAACYGPSGPVSRDSAEAELRQVIIEAVPPLRPSRMPRQAALVHIPVLFDSGQQGGIQRVDRTIVDLPVTLEMEPAWEWTFADGAREATRQPEARHVYRAGVRSAVEVAALWRGRYWVAGLGPLPITEPVVQRTSLAILVGEGRAVLVR